VAIPLADGRERLRHPGAYGFVSDIAEFSTRLWGADRNGDDDPRGLVFSHRLHRRPHRRPGGQSIVDENRGSIAEIDQRTALTIFTFATLQLRELLPGDGIDDGLRNSVPSDHVVAQHPHASRRDRADRELGMARHAKSPYDADLQR